MMKRVLSAILACILAAMVSACGGAPPSRVAPNNGGQPIEIRVFSNLPDRTKDQGLVEQIIFDEYMSKNPGITISVEALDDEAYKIKFKAYAAGTNMPDLISVWGQPGFIAEVIEAGLLEELDESAYADYGFIEGSLDGFKGVDGRLYGLPRNTDVPGIYYNKALFDENVWTIPASFGELLELCERVRRAGYEPISIDGADKWPLAIFYHDMLMKYHGQNLAPLYASAIGGGGFASEPIFLELAELYQSSAAALFQSGFEIQDDATALNLFAQGRAAMYYTGSWKMSMANDANIAPAVRENIRVFTMPRIEGGAGGVADIAAWNGGGHSVTANGRQKAEAVKLLDYMYRPENWTRIAWENNVCMSAQDFAQYKTGNETPVQQQFIDIVQNAANLSGTPLNDSGTAQFKTQSESLSQQLATSMITPEQFIEELGR